MIISVDEFVKYMKSIGIVDIDVIANVVEQPNNKSFDIDSARFGAIEYPYGHNTVHPVNPIKYEYTVKATVYPKMEKALTIDDKQY